jgi:hypothetical protein
VDFQSKNKLTFFFGLASNLLGGTSYLKWYEGSLLPFSLNSFFGTKTPPHYVLPFTPSILKGVTLFFQPFIKTGFKDILFL